MIECEDCLNFVDRPATLEPHPKLKPLSGRRLGAGWREVYQCSTCGEVLQRFALPPDMPTTERWGRKG